ncbi:hypothetical protein BZG36_03590 [Bifiguratus adelaidae]|uniref:Uncharacterized protein n=1 Tax=Bifiguratus adelaidae TaxID=1938954 RepID=A0A261XYH5_9FUNG|nr:hypothetical protein BZG36_03590 [Bifiguratus adelaidae]
MGGLIDQTQVYQNHNITVTTDDLKAHNQVIILNSCGFAFACCFIFINLRMLLQARKRIFILNFLQSVCAATGLFSLGVYNQVAYPHSCAAMMFFNIFGTAMCIGLCQMVCVERLATIVNRMWVWGVSLPLICSHVVLYCYMYLTEEYSIDEWGACSNPDRQAFVIAYMCLTIATDVYISGHFIFTLWQYMYRSKKLGAESGMQSYFKGLVDLSLFCALVMNVSAIIYWIILLTQSYGDMYFLVFVLIVLTPSGTTTFLCWRVTQLKAKMRLHSEDASTFRRHASPHLRQSHKPGEDFYVLEDQI